MLIQLALTLDLIYEICSLLLLRQEVTQIRYIGGCSFTLVLVMDDICPIGTQGKQPATKTTSQDSLFTSKHSEIAMISETCVEPTQSGVFYASKILSFTTVF